MRVCAHIYVLDFGAVLAEGTPTAIQQNRAVLDAYLGSPMEVQ
jgi:ABC-type branched-subunit amino acid transport system ATPase component